MIVVRIHVGEGRGVQTTEFPRPSTSIRLHLIRSTAPTILRETCLEPGSSNVSSHVYETETASPSWAPEFDQSFEFVASSASADALLLHVLHHSSLSPQTDDPVALGWVLLPLPHPSYPGEVQPELEWHNVLPLADLGSNPAHPAANGKISLSLSTWHADAAAKRSAFRPGTLNLTLLEAKGLPVMDFRGSSDPYAEVFLLSSRPPKLARPDAPPPQELVKTSFATDPVPKSLNPVWDKTTMLTISSPDETLLFRVWDRDRNTRDLLGTASESLSILVSDIFSNVSGRTKQVYTLDTPPSSSSFSSSIPELPPPDPPTLTVLYDWEPDAYEGPSQIKEEGKGEDVASASSTTPHAEGQDSSLRLSIYNAVDLPATSPVVVAYLLEPGAPSLDGRLGSTMPDTSMITSFETQTAQHDSDPVWNASMSFPLPFISSPDDMEQTSLVLRVFDDKDTRTLVASTSFRLSEVVDSLQHSSSEAKTWLSLDPQGSVHVGTQYTAGLAIPAMGSLRVMVESARGIPRSVRTQAYPRVRVDISSPSFASGEVESVRGLTTSHAPTFGASVSLSIRDRLERSSVLLTLYDESSSPPISLGYAKVPLKPLAKSSRISPAWIMLEPPAASSGLQSDRAPRCQLRCGFQWIAQQPPPPASSSAHQETGVGAGGGEGNSGGRKSVVGEERSTLVKGHVVFTVLSGKSLGVSAGFRGSRRVTVAVQNSRLQDVQVESTHDVTKVVNPSWNSTFVFSTPPRYGRIVGRVYDMDERDSVLMGTFALPVVDIINAAPSVMDTLLRMEDAPTGSVRVRAVYKTGPVQDRDTVTSSPLPNDLPVLPPIGLSPIPNIPSERASDTPAAKRAKAAARTLLFPSGGNNGALALSSSNTTDSLLDVVRAEVAHFVQSSAQSPDSALLGALGVSALEASGSLSFLSPVVFSHVLAGSPRTLHTLLDGVLEEEVGVLDSVELLASASGPYVLVRTRLNDTPSVVVVGLVPFAGLSHPHTVLYHALGALAETDPEEEPFDRVVAVWLHQLSHPTLFGSPDLYAATTSLADPDESGPGVPPLVTAHFVALDRFAVADAQVGGTPLPPSLVRLFHFILHSQEYAQISAWTADMVALDLLAAIKALSVLATSPPFARLVAIHELSVAGALQTGFQLIDLSRSIPTPGPPGPE